MTSTETDDPEGGAAAELRSAVVVEDDHDERALVSTLLESAGFVVRAFASVGEAVAAVRAERPDVVLTDLMLGIESGTDLAARLRAMPESADVAIVAMTGLVEPEWAVMRHFDAYLRKPIEPALLLPLVTQLARAPRAKRG